MNINIASQNQGVLAFANALAIGSVGGAVDIRNHVNFGFTFQVIADIAADAIFEIEAAPADDANPCIAGAFHNVEEVLTCRSAWGAVGAVDSKITIPTGTKAGSICTATLPCKPDAFVKVLEVSGDTDKVIVVVVLGGPK